MDEKKEVTHGLPKRDVFDTPPPATPIPGITGNPPLPPARMVSTASLTPTELATLKTLPGWKEGDPVPENLAAILAQVSEDVRTDTRPENLSSPVSPDTPPLQVPRAIDISKLPHDKQMEVQSQIQQATAAAQRRKDIADSVIDGAAPGVNAAIAGMNVRHVELDDDLDSDTYSSGQPKEPKETKPEDKLPSSGLENAVSQFCQHCNWNLNEPDIPAPSLVDRQRYLQAILGSIPFEKQFKLFGGKLSVTYRELRPSEIDLIYKQVFRERQREEILSADDFFEQLNKYRLCLQLVALESSEQIDRFPTSLKEWAGENPVSDETDTIIKFIHDQMYEKVIRTESINRTLGIKMLQFNRLLTKLEANSENSDFWKETEQAT